MKRTILILLCIWVALSSVAQVTFQTKAPKSVGGNEQFRVQYVLSNADCDDFIAPSFSDFKVLGGPFTSTYSSTQIVNSHATHTTSITYTYTLLPTKKGTFHVPGAAVKVGGRTMKSQPATVVVRGEISANSNNSQQSQMDDDEIAMHPQASEQGIGANDLYFTAEATKHKVYEQEPIVVTYKFHSKVGVRLMNVMPRQRPDMKGFWTNEIEIPNNIAPTAERHNGVLYRVGTNMQYVIFPQQTGKLIIPGITFDCDIVQRNTKFDELDAIDALFNGVTDFTVKVQRNSPDINIEVLPLPTPKPTDFSGGVGQFTAKAQLITPQPKTNDIATLRIVVQGSGNMKMLKAPMVKFPKDFDTYDAKMSDNIKISTNGITGEVYFDYTFVPQNEGKYEIPSAEFVYFDTAKKEYVTLHTQSIPLDVKKGKRTREDVEAEMAMRNADIRDIHDASASAHRTSGVAAVVWPGTAGYFALLAAIVASLTALLRWVKKRFALNADVAGRRNRKAHKKANRHLRNAEKALASGNHDEFYAALAQAIRGYFADKFALETAALTNEEIIKQLNERSVAEDLVLRTKEMLEDCDFARYAPSAEASRREQDLQRASDLVNQLEASFK